MSPTILDAPTLALAARTLPCLRPGSVVLIALVDENAVLDAQALRYALARASGLQADDLTVSVRPGAVEVSR